MIISAFNTRTNVFYPYHQYYFYSLRDAKRAYRAKYGLIGKHGIRFYLHGNGVNMKEV